LLPCGTPFLRTAAFQGPFFLACADFIAADNFSRRSAVHCPLPLDVAGLGDDSVDGIYNSPRLICIRSEIQHAVLPLRETPLSLAHNLGPESLDLLVPVVVVLRTAFANVGALSALVVTFLDGARAVTLGVAIGHSYSFVLMTL
jgi:hypothetical protein